jgi:uncharacterized iron-regulated membrane protein
MTTWADKRLYTLQPSGFTALLSSSALVESYRSARPQSNPLSLALSSDPAMPASITAAPNTVTFINPYTGEVLGEGSQGIRKFFRVMTDWHRWLALSGERRGIGKAITGACNFAFVFLAVSGLYLWWPRTWTRQIFRTIGWFRVGLTAKARDFNWHHVFGFWCLVPLMLIIVSALVISYPWAGRLLFKMAGSKMTYQAGPPRGQRGGPPSGPGAQGPMPGHGAAGEQAPLQLAGIDRMLESIQGQTDGWKTISISLPTVKDKAVAFAVEKGFAGQPQHRSTITLDNATGAILKVETFGNLDPGLRARLWMRFVHTGEYYGLSGQTIAGIASLAGAILVWTGFALTYRRFFSSHEREER